MKFKPGSEVLEFFYVVKDT